MGLSNFSIRRPLTVWMIVLAMLIFGFVSIPKMAVELFPELDLPVAVVVTSMDGGTPEEVENLVTKPIEEAMASVEGVNTITSNSVSGASQVIVEFDWGTDLDQATLDMRDQLELVRGQLPDSAHTPRILKFDPNSQPIIILGLTGSEDVTTLKDMAEDVIKQRLERIDGVASVGVAGGRERVIEITLDPLKLEAYQLTLSQVQQALVATNLSGSAGKVIEGDEKLQIRVEGEYPTVEKIEETPISVPGGSIPLRDIATVQDTLEEVTQLGYLNGKPALGLTVMKSSGGNTVEVAEAVLKEVEEIKKDLPQGYELTLIIDFSEYIKDSILTVAEHALLGGALAVLILYLFLNSTRSTVIVSIVLPVSVITTFSLMYFSGQTINLISLTGLLLGLGSLVDFAVVILENIFRHRQQGKSPLEAAREGSKQVGNAVMASALAQIVVFLPVVFTEGLAAELFTPLALAVIFSHLAALIVSIMLVPMLSARWLNKIPDESLYHTAAYKGFNPAVWFNIGFTKLSRVYGRLLSWALRRRKTVFVLTLALFAGTIPLFPLVGMEFIPKMDQGYIQISVEMPTGTMLEETEKVVKQIEQVVREVPELKLMFSNIGASGAPSALSANMSDRAQLYLSLVDLKQRERSATQIVDELRNKLTFIPDAKIEIEEIDPLGGGGAEAKPIQVNLRGDDLSVLQELSQTIAEEVKKVEGTFNVETSLEKTQKEYKVKVDALRASQYGLNTMQVISAVRTAFDGEKVTTFRTGDDEIDIKLTLPKAYQEDKTYLEGLRITTAQGGTVALSSVAEIVKEDVPQTIRRTDQTREVQITADFSGRDLGSVMREVQGRLAQLQLPSGYQIEYGGESQDMMESFTLLGFALILSIVLVYMVMVAQFESLLSPFIIMFSIPPTLIGVVAGLLVTGYSLSVMAIIGYILLVGIVVNNAIVLIDYINQLRQSGMARNEAILQAGPIRLRPILMTTLATILAILPLAFGGGSGNEGQAPMAIVVVFGLSFSTLITLFLIPVVYTWFDDWQTKWRNFRAAKRSSASQDAMPIQ